MIDNPASDEFRQLYDQHKDDPRFIAYAMVSDTIDAICDEQAALDWTDDEVAAMVGKTAAEYRAFLEADENASMVELVTWMQAVGLPTGVRFMD